MRALGRGEQCQSGFVDGAHLDEYLAGKAYLATGAGVFKLHAAGPVTREWIRTGKAKAVCTYRDPRDCVASDMVFMGQGFDKSVSRVVSSLQALDSYSDFGRTLYVRYEEMMRDRVEHIRLIAAYLNVPVDRGAVEAIDRQTNLENSREVCARIPSMGNDVAPMLEAVAHRRHIETLLHENHIGSARPGRWKTDLTEMQGRKLTHLFSNFLIAMGYETVQSIQANLLQLQASGGVGAQQAGAAKRSA
jgi:hypothetical protein